MKGDSLKEEAVLSFYNFTQTVDLRDIMKAQTYDAKVNHNVNVTGIPTPEAPDVNVEVKADIPVKASKSRARSKKDTDNGTAD